jgi:quercetin dioxygenase-like cupin family protein
MRSFGIISQTAIGCGGVIAGWLMAAGQLGYILEGNYEVKINDGPVQTLKSGDVFYEAPNALHAISRNASATQPLRYLVIQVSDPTKPATVPE